MKHQMERRMNARKPLRFPATIRYRSMDASLSMPTMTRNLSFEGTFLETGEIAQLEGSIVRVELAALPSDPITIDALVVHGNRDGIGLMFAYYGNTVFEQLASVLEAEPDPDGGGVDSGPGTPMQYS